MGERKRKTFSQSAIHLQFEPHSIWHLAKSLPPPPARSVHIQIGIPGSECKAFLPNKKRKIVVDCMKKVNNNEIKSLKMEGSKSFTIPILMLLSLFCSIFTLKAAFRPLRAAPFASTDQVSKRSPKLLQLNVNLSPIN